MDIIRNIIWRQLDKLQFGRDASIIRIGQVPIGYGGQMAGRILGLKIGLALGRKAVFASDADPPYVQSLVRPFSWDTSSLTAMTPPHVEPFLNDPRPFVGFDYFHCSELLRYQALNVSSWVAQRLMAAFAPNDVDMKKIDGWIFAWLRFIPEFEERLERDRNRLGVSQETLGVHLRRGDKRIESACVPAVYFNDAIRRIHEAWKFDRLFLATDDPRAHDALILPRGVGLIFDAAEKRYNNANHKMLMANPHLAAEETYIAFKNLRLLATCGGIVGQDSAHFATIASSYILQRDLRPERITLLNGRIAEERSASLKLLYDAKRTVRALAKGIMPSGALRFLNAMRRRR